MGDPPAVNRLYFGDCLEVMREDIPDESVDLIYLDPPFNSKRLYNAYIGGPQWVAFNDTWQWYEAIEDFHEVAGDVTLGDTMEGLRRILGEGPNLAYLSYMANRLRECRRALKPTGSIYLHCDPTMSHYLKVVDYQPTKAEMNEPIVIDRGGLSADEAASRVARRVTAPADVAEVSAADWRKRRKQAAARAKLTRR